MRAFFAIEILVFVASRNSTNTMIFVNTKVSYCVAHQNCFQMGLIHGRLGYMVGWQYLELIRDYNVSANMWVNMHALLHPVCQMRDRMWISGEKISKFYGAVIHTGGNEKTAGLLRVAVYIAGKQLQRTKTKNEDYTYGCDFGAVRSRNSNVRREMFVSDIRDFNELRVNSDESAGCFTSETGTTTIACANK